MDDDPSPRSTPLVLALVLVAAALAGCAQSPPPDDPSAESYIYRADHPEKAPHPASYEGGYDSLVLDGPRLEVGVDGPLEVLEEDPGGPVAFPARVEIHGASGTFDPDDGDPVDLDGETAHVTASDSFEVPGVRSLETRHATVHDGLLEARSTVAPDNDSFETSRWITVGGDGAVAADVTVALGDDARAQDGRNGTLTLENGGYGLAGSPVGVTPSGPIQVPQAAGDVTLAGPTANVTLRGQQHAVDHVRLEATRVTGTVDAAAGEATLTAGLHQWWQADRPQFEASLDAAFDRGGRTAEVTLEQGGNTTFWTKATETGDVGSAEAVRPQVEGPPGPDDAPVVDAGFGVYWYDDPDPSAMEQFLRAIVFPAKALQGLLEDPATREFAPGVTAYIPFAVEVADDAPPGAYDVEAWFHGENAKSQRLQVQVVVEQG